MTAREWRISISFRDCATRSCGRGMVTASRGGVTHPYAEARPRRDPWSRAQSRRDRRVVRAGDVDTSAEGMPDGAQRMGRSAGAMTASRARTGSGTCPRRFRPRGAWCSRTRRRCARERRDAGSAPPTRARPARVRRAVRGRRRPPFAAAAAITERGRCGRHDERSPTSALPRGRTRGAGTARERNRCAALEAVAVALDLAARDGHPLSDALYGRSDGPSEEAPRRCTPGHPSRVKSGRQVAAGVNESKLFDDAAHQIGDLGCRATRTSMQNDSSISPSGTRP